MQPAPDEERVIRQIAIEDLEPDPFQPRKQFRDEGIRELAASIEKHGLLQPLVVRPRQGPHSEGKFWIVAGERRYRAAKLLGLAVLPCQIQPYANTAAAVIALVENVHREDLSDIEKAEALIRIKTVTDKGWEEVADLVKLSHAYVRRLVGLVRLSEPVKEMVRRGEISARTALALKPLPPQRQLEMAQRVVGEGLTAEQVREESRTVNPPRRERRAVPEFELPDLALETAEVSTGPAAVTRSLGEVLTQLERIGEWLRSMPWTPSRLSDEQKLLLEHVYHAASQLQQQAAQIRRPLQEAAREEELSKRSPFGV